MIVPIILCGGSGTRLWPLSSNERPKQLLPLFSSLSLCQQTALRFHEKGWPLVLVCGRRYASLIESQLHAIHIKEYTMIIEPVGRDTAPAIALAAEVVQKATPEATMLVVPSDHIIMNTECFFEAVEQAHKSIKNESRFVLFGITPTHPEAGYGYIKPSQNTLKTPVQPIEHFVEKPSEDNAKSLIAQGYLWNSGMFMLPVSLYNEELKRYQPAIGRAAKQAITSAKITNHCIYPDESSFLAAPAISIDYALMQETTHASVIELKDSGWSDIGSWDAVWKLSPKDQHMNVNLGQVTSEQCHQSLLVSESGTLVAMGLDDYIVIHTAEATLVMPRSQSQHLKSMLQKMKDAA